MCGCANRPCSSSSASSLRIVDGALLQLRFVIEQVAHDPRHALFNILVLDGDPVPQQDRAPFFDRRLLHCSNDLALRGAPLDEIVAVSCQPQSPLGVRTLWPAPAKMWRYCPFLLS